MYSNVRIKPVIPKERTWELSSVREADEKCDCSSCAAYDVAFYNK
jgi:hypothetical protein